MKQEINQEKLTETKTEEEVNPYKRVILNNVYKDQIRTAQMEFWSILSDNVKYVRHEKEKTVNNSDVDNLDYRKHKKLYGSLKAEEKQTLDIHFGDNPNIEDKLPRYV